MDNEPDPVQQDIIARQFAEASLTILRQLHSTDGGIASCGESFLLYKTASSYDFEMFDCWFVRIIGCRCTGDTQASFGDDSDSSAAGYGDKDPPTLKPEPATNNLTTKDPAMMKRPPQILVRGCAYGNLK
jgi:hypothetical protein